MCNGKFYRCKSFLGIAMLSGCGVRELIQFGSGRYVFGH